MTETAATNRNTKNYSVFELFFGNLASVGWIALGAIAAGVFYPVFGLGYFSLVCFLIFYEIGKHGCVTCYYCKTCTIGMGKLPEFFFKKGGAANVNRRALRIFPFVFVLLSVVPVALLVFSIIQELMFYKVVLLVAVLVFSIFNGTVRRKTLFP